jgi:2-polyprenyl-6-methoxyphenol hydroxylase-like FAD-dependent oxidoreductase
MASDIAIVGAGIGGLTTGIALAQRGIAFRIFEAAPELREVGAGIWVPPNGLEVLARLGAAQAVKEAGTPIEIAELSDYRAGVLQRAETRSSLGHATVAIHRGALQKLLAERVPRESLCLGRQCSGVEAKDGAVLVRFADGQTFEASAVIGADGLASSVRASLFPEVQPNYSGQTSWRGVVDYELPQPFNRVSAEIWAPERRFGFSSIGGRRTYWYATADAPAGTRLSADDAKRKLTSLFTEFAPPVPSLIAETPGEAMIQTDLSDLDPETQWTSGRIALLGDAAHATTPNLGQGGAQAIEDAWVIADQIARRDRIEDAFAEYERRRRPKASMLIRRARQMGRMAHLGSTGARLMRNMLVRQTPASITRRELEKIYQPPE